MIKLELEEALEKGLKRLKIRLGPRVFREELLRQATEDDRKGYSRAEFKREIKRVNLPEKYVQKRLTQPPEVALKDPRYLAFLDMIGKGTWLTEIQREALHGPLDLPAFRREATAPNGCGIYHCAYPADAANALRRYEPRIDTLVKTGKIEVEDISLYFKGKQIGGLGHEVTTGLIDTTIYPDKDEAKVLRKKLRRLEALAEQPYRVGEFAEAIVGFMEG